jgi:hypothetical protein
LETCSYGENLTKLFEGPFTDEMRGPKAAVTRPSRIALHRKMERMWLWWNSWRKSSTGSREMKTWREI